MTEMNRAYQMLSERTQAYKAKRIGAITKMGERRLHLMQSPRKYAGEDEYVKQQEREEWRYVYGKDKFTEKCRIL